MAKRKVWLVLGCGWRVQFLSQHKADQYALHVRRKYGTLVYVEAASPCHATSVSFMFVLRMLFIKSILINRFMPG